MVAADDEGLRWAMIDFRCRDLEKRIDQIDRDLCEIEAGLATISRDLMQLQFMAAFMLLLTWVTVVVVWTR